MKLNEITESLISESYAGFEHKGLDLSSLQEWVESGGNQIAEKNVSASCKMAQLMERYINETNVSDNIAKFVPKLQPLLRRIVPDLMAFEIASVQPINTPTASIFMVKAQYSGSQTNTADKTTSVILKMTQGATAQPIVIGDQLTANNGGQGTVVYVEPDYSKAIVNVTAGIFVAGDLVDVGATYSAGANDITVDAVYSNEAGFKQILSNYSGPYTTAQGEVLGSDMRQIRVNIVSQGVSATTRKLKAQLTLEVINDMLNIHGASAKQEIIFFLKTEITNDMNREIIEEYQKISVSLPDYNVVPTASVNNLHLNYQDMYSGLYDRILKDCIAVSVRNRRAKANKLVATSGVIAALQSLRLLTTTNIVAADNHGETYVGTLPNGVDVYQDWFETTEYYMAIYKGANDYDSGLIYSPYVPLELIEAVDANTLQPVLGMSTRYALTKNVLTDNENVSVSDYCSIRNVVFTNTPLL